jgi:division/cell wall cluster transcriptional repressor MraZ
VVVSGNLWHKVVTNGEKLKNRGKIAMLLLTGEYQHVIDDKSRVLISNKLRSQIDVDEHGSSFYLVLGANGVLCLYPEKYFEQIVQAVAPATSAADEAVSFERMSFALASKVELDSQGRLLINERPYRGLEQPKLGTIYRRPYGSVPESDGSGPQRCVTEAEPRVPILRCFAKWVPQEI